MAPPPSRGSSRSGSSSRGGGSSRSGGSGGGGGSTNTAATIVAVAVVGLIIGGVVLMSGKKKEAPKSTLPAAVPAAAPKAAVDTTPKAKPFPPMPQEKVTEAVALVKTFEADSAKADAIYAESLRAKADGDDVKWQAKFTEFDHLLQGIKRKWTDFIDSLPSNADYDVEEVARHYFEKEGGRVAQLTKKLAASKTDQR